MFGYLLVWGTDTVARILMIPPFYAMILWRGPLMYTPLLLRSNHVFADG